MPDAGVRREHVLHPPVATGEQLRQAGREESLPDRQDSEPEPEVRRPREQLQEEEEGKSIAVIL